MTQQDDTPVRIRMGKYLVQNLFYPAFLGSFFFTIIKSIADKIRDPIKADNFLSDPTDLLLLKLFLSISIILFYLCDYLYSYVTKKYKTDYFLVDAVAMSTLVFSFFAARIDVTGELNMNNLVIPFLVFFFFFSLWDWTLFKGIDKNSKDTNLIKKRQFFRCLAFWQIGGFSALGLFFLLYHLNVISATLLAIEFTLILFSSAWFYFWRVKDKEELT